MEKQSKLLEDQNNDEDSERLNFFNKYTTSENRTIDTYYSYWYNYKFEIIEQTIVFTNKTFNWRKYTLDINEVAKKIGPFFSKDMTYYLLDEYFGNIYNLCINSLKPKSNIFKISSDRKLLSFELKFPVGNDKKIIKIPLIAKLEETNILNENLLENLIEQKLNEILNLDNEIKQKNDEYIACKNNYAKMYEKVSKSLDN